MRGSIRRRGGTWTAYWAVAGPIGERRQRTKGGFRTRKLAQAHLSEVLGGLAAGSYVEPTKLTVTQYLIEEWLPSMRASIRASTFDGYERNLRHHVLPYLGGLHLHDVGPEHLNRLYAELADHGRTDGAGGLSVKTVRHIHTTLSKAFGDAAKWSKIPRNPVTSSSPPKLSAAPQSEMRTWSAAELRAFLDHVRGDRLEAAWVLAATTGMRRGEVLGLRWSDVNVSRRQLAVRQTLVSVNYEVQFSAPKTGRSTRVVELDDKTLTTLRTHRARQAEEKLAWGEAYDDHGLVFTREDGRWIHPDRFSQMFDLHVRHSGLPRIRLHDLRHTYATLALEAGVRVEVVSRRLGHATAAFTEQVYTHAVPALQEEAASKVAALIFGG